MVSLPQSIAALLLALCLAFSTAAPASAAARPLRPSKPAAGSKPWCGPAGGPWRALPSGGNISMALQEEIVGQFVANQQANSTFSPCEEEEFKTSIQGCIRLTDNTTDYKLWLTLACPVGDAEVAVVLQVEATEPRGDSEEEGDALTAVLDVDVLSVRVDGEKVQGRESPDEDFFPEVKLAAPRTKPQTAPAPAAVA